MKYLTLLLRPEDSLKNLLVFAPVFFASRLNSQNVVVCVMLFLAFSFVANAVYLINDLHDLENDRLHEKKKNRALASGKISQRTAVICCILFLCIGLILSILISFTCFYILLTYLFINILYSKWLKKIALVDLIVVSSGFLLRVFIGGVATDVKLSVWLILITFLLSIFILFAKRRDDLLILKRSNIPMRDSISGYNFEFVNAGMIVTSTVLIVAYIMYCVTPAINANDDREYLYFTSFFVIIGVLRFLQITFVFNESGSPIKILLKDIFLQILVIAWLVFFYLVLYIY